MDLDDLEFNLDLSDITDINIDTDIMLNDLVDILQDLKDTTQVFNIDEASF